MAEEIKTDGTSLDQLGQLLAKQGTGKDTLLVHMNKDEFKALETKLGFKAKKNPITGLPAFDPDDGGDDGSGGDSGDPEGSAGTAGEPDPKKPGDAAAAEADDTTDTSKILAQTKQTAAQAPNATADTVAKSLTTGNNVIQQQLQQLAASRKTQNNSITAFSNALGFLGDHLISTDVGDSIRNAGKFLTDLPKQLESAFTAHAKTTAQQTSEAIMNQAVPGLAKKFQVPPPMQYAADGANDQLNKSAGINAITNNMAQ